MKLIDYLIVASLVGCMFIGYSGHRLIAVLLLILIAIVASWRFWDRRREKEMGRTGCSGELNPELDDVSTGGDVGGADHD
ncbi:MAG: hypothetical protein AB1705_05030 [Verrucomicrobiota bacterium]